MDYDDGLDAIAVPVQYEGALLGCLNIIWIRSLLSRKSIITRHLTDLKLTAQAISASFSSLIAEKATADKASNELSLSDE